jgi:hypothetical protein
MPDENELESRYRREWLLAIGQRLRAEYDAPAQPLPPHLLALVKQLDDVPIQEPAKQPWISTPSASGRLYPPDGAKGRGTRARHAPRRAPIADCHQSNPVFLILL